MSSKHVRATVIVVLALIAPGAASAGLAELAKCQKGIAGQGATFAKRTITATLKCTQAIADCQIQCELGVFGPVCGSPPVPPCCDVDDRNSIAGYTNCMNAADATCATQTQKIVDFEVRKQDKIAQSCILVTQEELCGTQAVGLNFDTLNAGCLAINPLYECNLTNLIQCVGGPLERQLIDQISALLQPRAADAVKAANLQGVFPDIPLTQKVTEDLPPGKVDVWALAGQADQVINVRVQTRDDGGGVSSLEPALVFLESDNATPIADTTVRAIECAFPSVCGGTCAQFKRTLTHNGVFHIAVKADTSAGCAGGRYKLIVTSPGGALPALVADDVNLPLPFP